MKVCALVDFMGSLDQTPEDEYAEIKKALVGAFGRDDFIFKTEVFPHQLANSKVDIYVFDFGGVGPGCEDMVMSHYRSLLTQIHEKPNCMFVIYSVFTQRWYEDAIREYAPELETTNMVYWSAKGCIEKLRKWVDCDEFKVRKEYALTKITKCIKPARGLTG